MQHRKEELIKIISGGLGKYDEYVELGIIYLSNAEYTKALDIFKEIKKRDLSAIKKAVVYHNEGYALTYSDRVEEAIAAYNHSLENLNICEDTYDRTNYRALNHYYLFLLSTKEDEGKKHANEALSNFELLKLYDEYKTDKEQHLIDSFTADIFLRIGNYEKAIATYNSALNLPLNDHDKAWIEVVWVVWTGNRDS